MATTVSHIGVILDGNRRFAKKLMLEPWKGHEWGKTKVKKLLGWAQELDISEVTLYAFSLQNFNRPEKEFNHLMKIFRESFTELLDDEKDSVKNVKISFIGRTQLFPEDLQTSIQKLEDSTKNNTPFVLNIAMAYGGREEIIDAVKLLAKDIEQKKLTSDDVSEETIAQHLMLSTSPDMIIRTGGDHRTSNFLPWQSIYSEWFFVDKTWPEFEKEDFVSCVNEFLSRERRFGQ